MFEEEVLLWRELKRQSIIDCGQMGSVGIIEFQKSKEEKNIFLFFQFGNLCVCVEFWWKIKA